MRTFLFLAAVLVIWTQETVKSEEIENEMIYAQNDDLNSYLEVPDDYRNLLKLSDIKDKIKKGILVAWEIFKVAAKNANIKIEAWLEQEKEKINKLNKTIVERLNKLKIDLENAITKITVIGDEVKVCLKENKNKIEDIFHTIASNMKMCLSNNVNKLTALKNSHVLLNIDDSTFLANVQKKIDTTCKDDNEKCLNDVQNEIIAEIEDAAQNISNEHVEARNAINDGIENTAICITESLSMAAKTIVEEIVEIIKCVKNKG